MLTTAPGPAIRLRIERNLQRGEYPIEVPHHVLVGKADDVETKVPLHSRVSREVNLALVRFAVEFDCKPLHRAEEIDDAPSEHFLTAELVAEQLFAPQSGPQALFRLGGVVAHLAGSLEQDLASDAITPNPLF